MSTVGLVILAAGASTRLGTPKQLLHYEGDSLLRRVVKTAIASNCDPIVVVLGAYAERMKLEISSLAVHVVKNSHWAKGMGTSIRAGITALNIQSPNLKAAIVLVCDQPFVSAQLIDRLIEQHDATAKPIVASSYEETLGVPALFSCSFFSKLIALDGSEGARHLIQRYCSETAYVLFPQGQIDIDTPNDYEQLQWVKTT